MNKQKLPFWRTPSGWSAIGLIAAASYFLFVEHGEHVFPYLPYLILLLCPVMHIFMHGSHGKGHETHTNDEQTFKEQTEDNDQYRQGYIEGLEQTRKERRKTESDNAR